MSLNEMFKSLWRYKTMTPNSIYCKVFQGQQKCILALKVFPSHNVVIKFLKTV